MVAVHRLDRLGRSTRDVLNLVHELDGKGASLRVLEPDVTTVGDLGRLVITVLGMVADMELKFIQDRQRAGLDAAKRKGVRENPEGADRTRPHRSVLALPSGRTLMRKCWRPLNSFVTNDSMRESVAGNCRENDRFPCA